MAKDRGLTMHVREFSPIKESLRTWVSLLALNGVWGLLRPRALIHSWNNKRDILGKLKIKNKKLQMEKVYMTFLCYFTNQQQKNKVVANTWEGATPLSLHCTQTFRANKLLLISAPSRRVCRSALDVSAPLSLPARSMRENFPCIFPFLRRMIWKTAWLRDEWALADVCPDVLLGGDQDDDEAAAARAKN